MEGLELVLLLLAVVAAVTLLAEQIRVPYPILMVVAGLGIGLFRRAGVPRRRARPRHRPHRLPAADPLLRRVLPVGPRAVAQHPADHAARRRARDHHDAWPSPSWRLLLAPRAGLADGDGARCHRLPARRDRGHVDRPAPEPAAPARDHLRGREPRERRHGADDLPPRRHRGRRHRRPTPAAWTFATRR